MYESGQRLLSSLTTGKGIDPEYFCPIDNPVDTPYRPYSPRAPDEEGNVITNIFVLNKDGRPKEISQISDVVASLSETQYSLRLYCPEDIREGVRKILK
jgi:HD superfamily phosphohydrolase